VVSRQLAMYRAGALISSLLPGQVACSLALHVGSLVGRLPDFDGMRAVVASHMRRVVGRDLTAPESRRMVREVFANYARYWAESLRLPSMSEAEVAAGISMVGFEHVQAGLDRGKGVIVVAPHLGGWEWGAMYLTGAGLPVTVAVEPLRPPDLFKWFVAFRERLGMTVVPVGLGAAAAILEALRQNNIVCLLADRLVGESTGIEVDFFGGPATMPAGPFTLAMRSGAVLLTAAIYYGRPEASHTIVFRPPLDVNLGGRFREAVEKGTQVLAGELEELIREAPTQWHLLQPNWADDPQVRHWRHPVRSQ
jgi:phosphatidylinositol dimannoside acyltransferase